MKDSLHNTDILSIQDLSLAQIQLILKTASQLKKKTAPNLLQNKIIANCFFEPSTRTRLSFETAALRLGAQNIGFSDATNTSAKKGENLSDSIKVIADYADLIVLRHPQEGAARLAAEVSSKPVINAGDGANQHPTQALIDLFTIQECQKTLDNLNIALVGDLKYGRTIHSFIQACALFSVRLFLVAPEVLTLPTYLCDILKKHSVRFSFHQSIEEIVPKVDILYMTRIQQERFSNAEYQPLKNQFILTPDTLKKAKSNLKILHPLPRVNEITPDIDKTPYAHYFAQAANGVCVRQALLSLLLNK
jgi:aspartate carbamoyltransferase catalytic subunit